MIRLHSAAQRSLTLFCVQFAGRTEKRKICLKCAMSYGMTDEVCMLRNIFENDEDEAQLLPYAHALTHCRMYIFLLAFILTLKAHNLSL